MQAKDYDEKQLHELIHQALETEAGGPRINETAIKRALTEEFKEELQEYLDQTRRIFGGRSCHPTSSRRDVADYKI